MVIPDLEQETKYVKEATAQDLSACGTKQLLVKTEEQVVIPELPNHPAAAQDVSKQSGSCHWGFFFDLIVPACAGCALKTPGQAEGPGCLPSGW